MTDIELMAAIGVAALVYVVLCNRVTSVLHPMRMKMAGLGEELLGSERLSGWAERHVQIWLDNAYCGWCAWIFVFTLPYAAISALVGSRKGRRDDVAAVPEDLRTDMDRFAFMSVVSVLGSSPIAAGLFCVEMVVFFLLFLPVGGLRREFFVTWEKLADVLSWVMNLFLKNTRDATFNSSSRQ